MQEVLIILIRCYYSMLFVFDLLASSVFPRNVFVFVRVPATGFTEEKQ